PSGLPQQSRLECEGSGDHCHAIVETFLDIEFLIMAGIENKLNLADLGCILQADPNRICGSFDRPKGCTRAGIAGKLAIIVPDNTQGEALYYVSPNCPFEVKVIPAVIVGEFIFETGGEADNTVELELAVLLDPGEGPAGID